VVVPDGTDVRETVREWDTQPPARRTAILRVRQGAGLGIRRHATVITGSTGAGSTRPADTGAGSTGPADTGAGSTGPADAGAGSTGPADTGRWDTVSVPFSDVSWFAEHVASFGTDVVALEPADLREAVITQLKGALA
jgi:proteasome accessory factor B